MDYITLHGSAFRKGDYKAVISTIAEAMAEKMAEGYKIDLAEMGKFYPTLDCKGAGDHRNRRVPREQGLSGDRHLQRRHSAPRV